MRILIVDDDDNIAYSLQEALSAQSRKVSVALNGREAIELIEKQTPDIVLLDLVLPEMNGLEVLKRCRAAGPEFIMITGFGSIDTAIEAMKLGAYDYLTKPVNLDELRLMLDRLENSIALKNENSELRSIIKRDEQEDFPDFIGKSDSIRNIKKTILQVADKKITVLITGESGTGKEIVANCIQANSGRSGNAYLKVNCGALSQGILESELFGHEKGAFTGAVSSKKGLFESADQGTLFLDEIGELPLESQVRLLRVLESGEFSRVGGVETRKTDVRIIAATNKDLEKEVAEGRFREDLFYRLKVITIQIPPLRERPEDIPFLVRRFMEQFNIENGTNFSAFSQDVVSLLASMEWKGNVRELKNMVDRILVFAQGSILRYEDLPDDLIKMDVQQFAREPQGTMEDIEKSVIERTLERTDNDIRRVSSILDIPLRTLYRKLKKYNLQER